MKRAKKCLISLLIWGVCSIILFGLLKADDPEVLNFQIYNKSYRNLLPISISNIRKSAQYYKKMKPGVLGTRTTIDVPKRGIIETRVDTTKETVIRVYPRYGDILGQKATQKFIIKALKDERGNFSFTRLDPFTRKAVPIKTIYLSSTGNPTIVEDVKFYPQTGPFKGLARRTLHKGYSLKHNVTKECIE